MSIPEHTAHHSWDMMRGKIQDWGVSQIMSATGKDSAAAEVELKRMLAAGERSVKENNLRAEAQQIVIHGAPVQVAARSPEDMQTLTRLIAEETEKHRAAEEAAKPWYVDAADSVSTVTYNIRHPIDYLTNSAMQMIGFDKNNVNNGGFMNQMTSMITDNPGKSALAAFVTGAILKSSFGNDDGATNGLMGGIGKAGIFAAIALFIGKLLVEFAFANAKSEEEWRSIADPLKNSIGTVCDALGFKTPDAIDSVLKLDRESMAKFSIQDAVVAVKETVGQVPEEKAQQFAEGVTKITAADDQPTNVLNTLKKVANLSVPSPIGPSTAGLSTGIDAAEKLLSTRIGSAVAKGVAGIAAPEFAPLTGPVIDQLSADAQENKAAKATAEAPAEDAQTTFLRKLTGRSDSNVSALRAAKKNAAVESVSFTPVEQAAMPSAMPSATPTQKKSRTI